MTFSDSFKVNGDFSNLVVVPETDQALDKFRHRNSSLNDQLLESSNPNEYTNMPFLTGLPRVTHVMVAADASR